MDNETAHHARRVAEAADAWLTDPRDTQTYQRLVDATLAWRIHAQPMLDGTQTAGRRSLPGHDAVLLDVRPDGRPVLAPDGLPGDGPDLLPGETPDVLPGDVPAVLPDEDPVERRPQRLDLLLGAWADDLRARTPNPPT